MTVFPASIVPIALWLFLSLRSADNGIPMTLAMLPFGMFAAVQIGSLSILSLQLMAMLTIGLLMLRWLRLGAALPQSLSHPASLFLMAYAAYALFSATILVRIFAGNFLVFPMNVTVTGTVVSLFFPSTMQPLTPGMSNLAQSLYILLSCGFFIASLGVYLRRSPRLGEAGLVAAASLNVALGLLDMVGLDPLLSAIRTADYSLANQQSTGGFARIIGGFSEASAYGAASAAFFAYFMMSFLVGRRPLHGFLAVANFATTVLSLSSSGLGAMSAACLMILLHLGVFFGRGMSREFGQWFVISVAVGLVAATVTLLVPGVTETAAEILDQLVFSKSDSLSGLERNAWSQAGFDAFVQTWGLGAGVGSLRANGLASVILGSVGIPGAIALTGFLFIAIGRAPVFADADDRRMFYAARVVALTQLAALAMAGTTPNPNILLITATAIATAARWRAMRAPEQDAIAVPGS